MSVFARVVQRAVARRVPLAMPRALAVLGIVTSGATARADDLAWQAPPGCPDAAAMETRIAARLDVNATVGGIEVSVEKTPRGFVATIDARAITVANAVRTLTSTRCDALADAVALVLVRLANEEAQEARSGSSPVLPAPSAPSVPRAPPLRDEPLRVVRDGEAAPRAWAVGVHLVGLSGIGVQPGVGVGGELATHVRRRELFAQLGHARWVPRSMNLVESAPGAIEVSLSTITMRLGWSPAHMPIRAWLLGEAGWLGGEGIALYENRMGTTRWAALGGGFGVGWPIAPLVRLTGTLELAAPLDRTRFVVGEREVHRPAAAAARTALGFEVGWR